MSTSKKAKKPAYTESHRHEHKAAATKHGRPEAGHPTHAAAHKLHKAAMKTVRDVMSPRVVAVTSITFLPEAARIMKEEDVGALPVVQADGKLLGIVTDRDITVRAVSAGLDPKRTQVAEVYTAEDLVTVTPDTGLQDAEAMMAEHQVRRLPIVDRHDKLVGLVSLADVVREQGREAGGVLKDISHPGGEHTQASE